MILSCIDARLAQRRDRRQRLDVQASRAAVPKAYLDWLRGRAGSDLITPESLAEWQAKRDAATPPYERAGYVAPSDDELREQLREASDMLDVLRGHGLTPRLVAERIDDARDSLADALRWEEDERS